MLFSLLFIFIISMISNFIIEDDSYDVETSEIIDEYEDTLIDSV